ncbi:restriction endonuclease subunit S [Aeromonas caviae]|uniref:restriction endonuclease subunit S n=1 Tax=Aeromonas caviae TaxID=648 RepID=UPI0038D132EA
MVRDQLPIVKLGKLLPQPYKNGIYKSADFYGAGTQILRITDFDNEGHLVTDELQCLHLENNEVENYKLTSRDIVINRVNSLTHIGKSILWLNNTDCTTVYESNMMRIQPDESAILPEYLIRILQSEPAREHFRKVAKRAVAQCSINQQDVKSLSFPLHPLPEQKKIAQILSTWDRAISATEQLLANSQQQKKALMQQLLTGKKRLLDNNGVGFSGEWKSYHLSHVTVIVMGSSPKSEAYNENGVGLPLLQGNADIKNRISAPRVFTSEITKECEIGDILLSVRAPVGTVAISEHKACIGRGIAALHAKPNFDQSFIYQFLLWFEPKWGSLSQGSTFESINSDDIKNLKIKVPNFGEQQKIAAVLTTADQEITTLQQKLDALKQEKQALMQQLLTGKRRVKVEEAA